MKLLRLKELSCSAG